MAKISKIQAREILDSRGNPTVEVELSLENGAFGRASIPSGASTGSHEAIELRDNDLKRYQGKGVLTAVKNIKEKIAPILVNQDWNQENLDKKMIDLDGTENKRHLGANAILGVSIAFAKAEAMSQKINLYQYFSQLAGNNDLKLPLPMMNILNGGQHAENSTDLQEFMIIPIGAANFKEALRYGAETFQALKKILSERGLVTTVGDEGGFAPKINSNTEAMELIMSAIRLADYQPGKDIALAIDAAASEFYQNGKYHLKTENKELSSEEMIAYYEDWLNKYPLLSIEDGLAEDDWSGYKILTKKLAHKIQIVGDDLFVTNSERLQTGINQEVGNSILIKPNQIGTISETIKTINLAKKNGYQIIISHRSGETEDTTIADLAVGVGAEKIKTGSLCRSERTAKYNQLLRIEEELG